MGFFGGGGSAGVGGSTGATDNAILRADGTGAATLQNSDLNVDDATTTTQNNVAITNQHSGQANSALVLTPKGTGAFIVGPKPDGTSTGGNARGANAIDIQTTRSANTRVASGSNSIAIGNDCRSPNSDDISIGRDNNNAGGGIIIGSGNLNADTPAIIIGNNNTAGGNQIVIIGNGANSAGIRSSFSTLQFRSAFWSGSTTNATPAVLNIAGTATNRFTIAANTAVIANLYIIARRTDTVDKWFSGQRKVAIRRNNANGTAIIGSVETIGADQTEGSPTWSVAITADDTNEALQCEVTGAASETVSWRVMAFYHVV